MSLTRKKVWMVWRSSRGGADALSMFAKGPHDTRYLSATLERFFQVELFPLAQKLNAFVWWKRWNCVRRPAATGWPCGRCAPSCSTWASPAPRATTAPWWRRCAAWCRAAPLSSAAPAWQRWWTRCGRVATSTSSRWWWEWTAPSTRRTLSKAPSHVAQGFSLNKKCYHCKKTKGCFTSVRFDKLKLFPLEGLFTFTALHKLVDLWVHSQIVSQVIKMIQFHQIGQKISFCRGVTKAIWVYLPPIILALSAPSQAQLLHWLHMYRLRHYMSWLIDGSVEDILSGFHPDPAATTPVTSTDKKSPTSNVHKNTTYEWSKQTS